ncbi:MULTISPECIES: ABC transporter permease [unclassified Clostridium]|uniref:ABC transporter permease n=1 Tax=unclassified Clostridium TaxID=2614128 RepID=UPI0025C1F8F4|nr:MULTISPECIES: ABC transporter permease [unclassified Clostridium]
MIKKCIKAELLKLRHSHIWLILIILPIVSILIGGANFYFNQGILQNEWYSLWTQVSLFYGEFFLPILISILCAYVCRLEHMNKNWNTVMTAPVSISSVFIAKLLIVGFLIFIVQTFFISLYFCSGKLFGFSSQIPKEIFGWMFRGWLASISIGSIQLWISIRIRSFAVPIGICVCTTFIGLGIYVAKFGMFFPYSFLTIGMGVLSQESLTIIENSIFLLMNLVFIIIFSHFTIKRLTKVDIIA